MAPVEYLDILLVPAGAILAVYLPYKLIDR